MPVEVLADADRSVRVERRASGVHLLVLDAPGRSANTMNDAYWRSMDASLDELAALAAADDLRGVVVTSAKRTFFAGGDLRMLRAVGPEDSDDITDFVVRVKAQLRRLETIGAPVVAAVNGSALGGGLELALSCHARVVVDDDSLALGLPEVTLGLLPAANGLTRTVHLLGARRALGDLLLTGATMTPRRALDLGLVDVLVPRAEDLLDAALAWVGAHPDATAPWDRPDHRVPDADVSHDRADVVRDLPEAARSALRGFPMPAPHAILGVAASALEGDFESLSDRESAAFVALVTGPVATNLIQSQFFDLQEVRSGATRPTAPTRFTPRTVGVVCAAPGAEDLAARLDAVLVDPASAPELVGTCDAVVVHDPSGSADLLRAVEAAARSEVLLLTTSTAPVSAQATALARPHRLVGIHGLAGVARAVEVVRGPATSEEALAHAMDLARSRRRLPLVVEDHPGLFDRLVDARGAEIAAARAEGASPEVVGEALAVAGYSGDPGPHPSAEAEGLAQRLLGVESAAALAAVRSGQVRSRAEANVGSLLISGFPAWTGGAVQHADPYEPNDEGAARA